MTPLLRIARRVEDAIETGHTAYLFVEARVRESPHQRSAIVVVDDSARLRAAKDILNAGINTAQELLTQADPLSLIPAVSLGDILLGFRGKNQISGHSVS